MQRETRFKFNAIIFTISSMISASIPFLLLPVLTRVLNPEEYGMVAMSSLLMSVFAVIIGLNADAAILRKFFDENKTGYKNYVCSGLFIYLISSVFILIISAVFNKTIFSLFGIPLFWIQIIVGTCCLQFLSRLALGVWQVKSDALKYGIFQITQSLCNGLAIIFFVVYLDMSWQGRLISQLLISIPLSCFSLLVIKRAGWLGGRITKSDIKHILAYGLPLIPHTLGGFIIVSTDRIFIKNMVGLDSVGYYTTGYQIGMIMNILVASYNNAYVPYLYSQLNKNSMSIKRKLVKSTYKYFLCLISLSIFLSIASPFLVSLLLGRQYSSSVYFVVWAALGYSFDGMYRMVVNYIFYSRKTHILAGITFFSAVLNIVLNYFFIRINGALGAAQSTTISFLVMFLLTWFFSNKIFKMPWINFAEKQVD